MTNPDHLDDSLAAVRKARELLHRARAVIFDFDGLLVDTEYAIYSSWERVFASCGHALPLDLFNQCLGSGYTHWNPGEHLEQLTGRTFDWEAVNGRRQERLARLRASAFMLSCRPPKSCLLFYIIALLLLACGVAHSIMLHTILYMEVLFVPAIAFFMGKMLMYMHLLTGGMRKMPAQEPER